MRNKKRFLISLILSIVCLGLAVWFTVGQKRLYDEALSRFPSGTTIAGIPVGGLDAQAAGQRVVQVYTQTPVQLRIDGSAVEIQPASAGQQLNLQSMLDAADRARRSVNYWAGFWDFLWRRLPASFNVPLACSVSTQQLRAFLEQEIVPRYTQPPQAAAPVPGDVLFRPGVSGVSLDLDSAEEKLQVALCSPTERVVDLTTTHVAAPTASLDSLGPVLETLTQVSNYDGVIEVYFQDLKTGKEINFAYNQGHPVSPGIAFTGASTIKIPVMVSAYRRAQSPLPDELAQRMSLMIDLSDNTSTDDVMKQTLDENLAPIEVTEDMQTLGLKNTFLAGFFYPGAPLLERYQTPANQRTDLDTQPDIYNQTTPADMGALLAAIERCASEGNGPLIQAFSGQITQAKCQEMTTLLKKNRKGVLLEAGLPESTPIAHKYGWVTDSTDGLLHTASDAAIIYTPGGNFVFTVYFYHPIQLPWDDAQRLVARLATAVYNFYNTAQ